MAILFSIIVPVYNVECYLKECVQSIQNQTYPNFEIILVDDGSTDASGNICDSCMKQHSNIQVIHQKNKGLSEARNTGMHYIRGEYVVFIDSDDYVANTMLKEMSDAIEEGSMPDVILPRGWYKVYENKISLEDTFEVTRMEKEISGIQALNNYLENKINGWTACGKCFSTTFWKENDFAFQTGIYYEDAQLIYKIIAKAAIVKMVPARYYYRKIRENSILSKPKAKVIFDYILILEEWNEYLENIGYEEKTKEMIKEAFAKEYITSILPSISFFSKDEKRDLLDKAKQIEYYLIYANNYLAKMIKLSIKIFGLSFTCKVLCILKMIKGKIV